MSGDTALARPVERGLRRTVGVPALFATQEWRGYIAGVPGMALIFLSLVLLAGYAGQISLGQAALAGFGAMIAAIVGESSAVNSRAISIATGCR